MRKYLELAANQPNQKNSEGREAQSRISQHARIHVDRMHHHPLHALGEQGIDRALDHQYERERRDQILGHDPPAGSMRLLRRIGRGRLAGRSTMLAAEILEEIAVR